MIVFPPPFLCFKMGEGVNDMIVIISRLYIYTRIDNLTTAIYFDLFFNYWDHPLIDPLISF